VRRGLLFNVGRIIALGVHRLELDWVSAVLLIEERSRFQCNRGYRRTEHNPVGLAPGTSRAERSHHGTPS
jgi:hypothetical protein